MRAVGEIFLIRRGGEAESGATAGLVGGLESLVDMVFERLGRGEVGSEGGWWVELDAGSGGGVLGMVVVRRLLKAVSGRRVACPRQMGRTALGLNEGHTQAIEGRGILFRA